MPFNTHAWYQIIYELLVALHHSIFGLPPRAQRLSVDTPRVQLDIQNSGQLWYSAQPDADHSLQRVSCNPAACVPLRPSNLGQTLC